MTKKKNQIQVILHLIDQIVVVVAAAAIIIMDAYVYVMVRLRHFAGPPEAVFVEV